MFFWPFVWAITWPEKSHRSHRSHRQESVQQITVALYVTWQFLAVLKPKTGRKKSDFPVRKMGFSENCGMFSLKYLKCLSWCLSENIGKNSLHLLLNHHVSWVVRYHKLGVHTTFFHSQVPFSPPAKPLHFQMLATERYEANGFTMQSISGNAEHQQTWLGMWVKTTHLWWYCWDGLLGFTVLPPYFLCFVNGVCVCPI